MSFFASIPEPPSPFEGAGLAARMRSDGVICGSTQADLLLISTDKVAVAVSSVRAYPNGFEFTVHARLRQETLQWGIGPLDPLADMRTRLAPEKALRLGVLYADDRRAAATAYRPAASREVGGEHLVLLEVGSRGTERQWDGDFWVHPLPPDGSVTFVASWLLYDVAETRAEMDGSAIRRAAARAVILWPDEPDDKPRNG